MMLGRETAYVKKVLEEMEESVRNKPTKALVNVHRECTVCT